MAEHSLSRAIAELAADVTADRLPAAVVSSTRMRVLDTLGLALRARDLDTSQAVIGYVADQGGRPEATGIGLQQRVPAALAGLVNGTLAHSLDYDDTHLPSVLHPSAAVVPAALAAAEAAGSSGAELVAAVAVGLETCVRIGMAGYDEEAGNSTYFEHGQHATSICGALGGAVSAAMLLGLDTDGIQSSLGVAASMASGIIEANRTGGTVKRVHCGWAAHSAVTAAHLVHRGITGPPTALEGRFGFFQAFLHGTFDGEQVTRGLGEEWAVPGIFFKPYPANHFTHTTVDAAAELRRQGVAPADVESIVVGVPAPVIRTIGEPIEVKRSPETGYQAQFSAPYAVTVGLLGGGGLGAGLDDYTDELARDPGRRDLMAKVSVVPDDTCTGIFPYQFPAVLTARLHDGRTLTVDVLTNRGGNERPLTDDEVGSKFADNAGAVIPAEDVAALRSAVLDLDHLDDVRTLLAPLGGS
ncbi:MmgE/PrpD family protein [Nocardioides hwasunensis]|uniref:MmgE/PrpD family protein n=1 Tax=Nocardioides hwasunensis TaxID=397258 RepID=A0ABR8MH47_9ACTN|nr:MmgE/PrpD family protein [Nocardioides hwasunensis]MBD3915403.1 MmgE/PrpD family protein [Nocardioides hwasunensis]